MPRPALSALVPAAALGAALFLIGAPAQAATYWCNDGAAVSNIASCKNHGGYTPIARSGGATAGPTGPGQPAGISDQAAAGNLTSFLPVKADEPCIFDRWGMLMPGPHGCRLPRGKESACLKGGGALGEAGRQKYCIPRQAR